MRTVAFWCKNSNVFLKNQINKVITSVSYYTHRHAAVEEEEWLTAERMAVSCDSRQSYNRLAES